MTLFFESDFVDGLVRIDPLADPYTKGSGELAVLAEPYYSWPNAGYALVRADPNVPDYTSQRAAFNVYVGTPPKTDLYARAMFLRTTELPLDTDHMLAGEDGWNWATLLNFSGVCSIRISQREGVDPPQHSWLLLLTYNDGGVIKYLNSSFAWDDWPIDVWKDIQIHWVRDAVNGGAEVFFGNVKVHELWGYDTANIGSEGVQYVRFGALTATQRYKDFGVVVDNIKIADSFIPTEDPTYPPPPVRLIYNSTPILVDALVDGVSLASGSFVEVEQGSVITVSVPSEVELS